MIVCALALWLSHFPPLITQKGLRGLVAGPGFEPRTEAYETSEMPFLYPAIDLYTVTLPSRSNARYHAKTGFTKCLYTILAPVEGVEPPPTVLETAVLPLYYTGIYYLLSNLDTVSFNLSSYLS